METRHSNNVSLQSCWRSLKKRHFNVFFFSWLWCILLFSGISANTVFQSVCCWGEMSVAKISLPYCNISTTWPNKLLVWVTKQSTRTNSPKWMQMRCHSAIWTWGSFISGHRLCSGCVCAYAPSWRCCGAHVYKPLEWVIICCWDTAGIIHPGI